jgi:hypothetical protein
MSMSIGKALIVYHQRKPGNGISKIVMLTQTKHLEFLFKTNPVSLALIIPGHLSGKWA